ncbi:hypothetical protein V6N12_058040, partial [Hibiscus sabdariffa]
ALVQGLHLVVEVVVMAVQGLLAQQVYLENKSFALPVEVYWQF